MPVIFCFLDSNLEMQLIINDFKFNNYFRRHAPTVLKMLTSAKVNPIGLRQKDKINHMNYFLRLFMQLAIYQGSFVMLPQKHLLETEVKD